MDNKKLMKTSIKNLTLSTERYFNVNDIANLYENAKFNTKNAIKVEFEGVEELYVKAEDVEEMTDFDKKILKTLNFSPKK